MTDKPHHAHSRPTNPPEAPAPGPPSPPSPPAPAPPQSPKEWFVHMNGQQSGPYTREELAAMAQTGQIAPNAMVWKQSMASWAPMNTVAELGGSRIPSLTPEQREAFERTLKHGAEVGKQATRDAFAAFRVFMAKPVAGLPVAYRSLSPAASLSTSIVYLIAYLLLITAGLILNDSLGAMMGAMNVSKFGVWIRIATTSVVPFVGIALLLLGAGKLMHAPETYHAALFTSGACMAPLGFATLVFSLLAGSSMPLAAAIQVFAICYVVLILYSGLTKIYQISDSWSSFFTPLIIVLNLWATWEVGKMMFSSMAHKAFDFTM
ncbi:MAG: DUF4339 domain-containing protein [Candidatus Sumerlaeota bacterium]|nr:DUF4339 domain-containing protein [Candidatus Sumerlaeota bacterium]